MLVIYFTQNNTENESELTAIITEQWETKRTKL